MSYAGDAAAKKFVRGQALMLAVEFLRQWPWPNDERGRAMVLGGDGGDLRVLRGMGAVRNWSSVAVAERDASRREALTRQWPQVAMHECALRALDGAEGCLRLAILDFCGHVQDSVVARAWSALVRNGVMVVAWERARGPRADWWATKLGVDPAAVRANWDGARNRRFLNALGRDDGTWSCTLLGIMRYWGGRPGAHPTTPMQYAIVAKQRPRDRLIGAGRVEQKMIALGKAVCAAMDTRAQALLMLDSGCESSSVDDLLNLAPGTARAWRAVRTRKARGPELARCATQT